ncbi:hypothetical protein GGS20DRAFT_110553 [Poronia punctata]|nr:hypothetical protein GGS20DRAFT_110553 [Poronia punctata]
MSVIDSSVSRMSPELWIQILHHFVPSGAPTTAPVQPSKAQVRPHVLEWRRTLWGACQVSRAISSSATSCLYRAVLINDCEELLYFYRTLRSVPRLRRLVRSFSWAGTLPPSDALDYSLCVQLMPSLPAVFTSIPAPVTEEDTFYHQFLHDDNLGAFRIWKLFGVVLAMMPRVTTLFLVLGDPRLGTREQELLIDYELDGRGTAEQIKCLLEVSQQPCEVRAIREAISSISPAIGRRLLPDLQVLILDHIGNNLTSLDAFRDDVVVCDLHQHCPQLRYIQSKASIFPRSYRKIEPSTSMRSLTMRKQLYPVSCIARLHEIYPNLTSLRMVIRNGSDDPHLALPASFEPLTKLRHLQYLSMTTPHHLGWSAPRSTPTMLHFLRQMESLQHLRIDLIWLATRSEPAQLVFLASFLPPCLETLHLIDYWGTTMTGGRSTGYFEYSDLILSNVFLRTILASLARGCVSVGLTSLKEVKISSDRSYPPGSLQLDFVAMARQFQECGIRLIKGGIDKVRQEEDEWWLSETC